MKVELIKEGNVFYVLGTNLQVGQLPDTELTERFPVEDSTVKIQVLPVGARKTPGILEGINSFLVLQDGPCKNKRLSTSSDKDGTLVVANIK
jgi:hypothetical protein